MTLVDLKIKGKILQAGKIIEGCIAVEAGKILAVGKTLSSLKSEKTYHLKENEIVLPGMVDIHIHARDLEQDYKEDWRSISRAALAGGVTFIADMPNTVPPTRALEALKKKLDVAKKSLVDYGIYSGVPENPKDLYKMYPTIIGIKIYAEDLIREDLQETLISAKKLNLPVIIHPEHPYLIRDVEILPRSLARPPEAELLAVRLMLSRALILNLPIHLTHLTLPESVMEVVKFRGKGLRVTMDVTPHHILLDNNIESILGKKAAVNPPLRPARTRTLLYNLFLQDVVDMFVSDHAPHTPDEKDAGAPGFPGVELALHLLLYLILEKEVSWRVIRKYSYFPATLLGIPKGELIPGMDADLTVVDIKYEWIIRNEDLYSKSKFTPFNGWRIKGKVVKTFVRGFLAFDEGSFLIKEGFGKIYGASHG